MPSRSLFSLAGLAGRVDSTPAIVKQTSWRSNGWGGVRVEARQSLYTAAILAQARLRLSTWGLRFDRQTAPVLAMASFAAPAFPGSHGVAPGSGLAGSRPLLPPPLADGESVGGGTAPAGAGPVPTGENAAPAPKAQAPPPPVLRVDASMAVNVAVAFMSYDFRLWAEFVEGLGDVIENISVADIFECTESRIMEAVSNIVVDGSPLNPLAEGRLLKQIRELAEAVGYVRPDLGGFRRQAAPPAAPHSGAAAAPAGAPGARDAPDSVVSAAAHAAAAAAAAAAVVPPVNHRRKFSSCLAAGDEGEFLLLPAEKVRKLTAEHREAWGAKTPEYENHNVDQLSAAAAKVANDEPPYADFSVFGPYGKRIQKLMSCRAQVFVEGELRTKTIQGPSSFDQWRRCWRVFRNLAVKLKLSKPGPLDAYEEGIRQLAQSFPNHWGLLVVVEDHMRSERWATIREELEIEWAAGRAPHGLTSERPWESVISFTAYGTGQDRDWWFARVDKPCLKTPSATGAAAQAAVVEGDIATEEVRQHQAAERPEGKGAGGGRTRKQEKTAAWLERVRNPASKPENTRGDGRFTHDEAGVELCWNWNRSMTGCGAAGCTATPKRSHLCEWCRGPHRAVDDSACKAASRPANWRPGKGRGQGGGRGRGGRR